MNHTEKEHSKSSHLVSKQGKQPSPQTKGTRYNLQVKSLLNLQVHYQFFRFCYIFSIPRAGNDTMFFIILNSSLSGNIIASVFAWIHTETDPAFSKAWLPSKLIKWEVTGPYFRVFCTYKLTKKWGNSSYKLVSTFFVKIAIFRLMRFSEISTHS